MAAVLGLEDGQVESICDAVRMETGEVVTPANYNCPGQLVISGSLKGIETACERLKAAGAKRALVLPVGGAFHSPLMASAQEELQQAIRNTTFSNPACPVYQNVVGTGVSDPGRIRQNLIDTNWMPTYIKIPSCASLEAIAVFFFSKNRKFFRVIKRTIFPSMSQ